MNILEDGSFIKLVDCPLNLFSLIRELTTLNIEVERREEIKKHIPIYYSSIMDPSASVLCKEQEEDRASFNVIITKGYLHTVIKYCNLLKIIYDLDAKLINSSPYIDEELLSPHLRDYQKAAVKKALQNKFITIKSPTGSGKTFIMSEILRFLPKDKNILFLVPKVSLLSQTRRVIEDYLQEYDKYERVGVIGSGEFDIERITIAIPNTLSRRLKTQKYGEDIIKYLESIHSLFIDECGEVLPTVTGWEVVNACSNRKFSIAVSATPKTNNGMKTLIEGLSGPLLFEISEKELIERGYIERPNIKIYEVPKTYITPRLINTRFNPKVYNILYDKCIVNHKERNLLIVDKVYEYVNESDLPIAIIVKRVGTSGSNKISHAIILQKLLKAKGLDFPIIHGKSGRSKIDSVLKDLKKGSIKGLISGPKTISSGVDVSSLGAVALAQGEKSDVDLIQRIGRSLRKDPKKNESLIIDCYDTQSWFQSHSKSRIRVSQSIYGQDSVTLYNLEGEEVPINTLY